MCYRTLLAFSMAIAFCAGWVFPTGCSQGVRHRPGYVSAVRPAMDAVVRVTKWQSNMLGESAIVGIGSAVVIDERGFLLTCWHVVAGASALTVDGGGATSVPALVVAKDELLDMALIKVDWSFDRHASWGSSGTLLPGDQVIMIGYPFAVAKVANIGHVSCMTFSHGYPLIMVDAAVNPGDSGGGLFDSCGDLVGLGDELYSPTGSNVGLGLCIPGNTAHLFVIKNLPLR